MRIAANGTLFLTEEGKKEAICFFIEGEPKRGGSCLVYSVRWQQAGTMFRGILKECYPSEWGNLPAIERKENGQLFIPEAWMEAYQNQLTKMRQAYELQMRISLQDHLVNRVVEERGIYYGCYGACYSLMAYADGVSYEQVRDSNLKQTLETLLSVARFLKIYHDAGYVHLDIKPENLLILPETRQLVKVLDYDSSVSLEELHTKMVRLSRSEQWEAPELAAFASGSGMTEREWMRKQRRIGIYTDQYPLGRILAKRLGIPEQLDHSIPKNWLWETNHPWLEEVRPCVREKLQQFFSHTLAIATQNRYPSDEALIAALEELVAASDPTAIFLRSSYLEKKATFYGREDELKQMERLQKERKRIFLTGMGGIGKSELARTYAVEHRREYDTVILARYESTLEDVIRRVGIEHLVHFGGEGLPPEQYFALAKRKLKECCVEEKVLLILDNLDVDSDTGMQEFLEMGWDVIVTTRYHWEEYEDDCVFVKEFDEEGAFELFCRNYGKTKEEFNEEERLLILELIKLVEYHTMTVELLAKQTAKEEADFKTFLKELKEGIKHHDQTKIPHIKDGSYGKKSMYQHIAALFSIAKEKEKNWISETEEALLRHMTLISYQGIEGKQFLTWCGYPESDLPILKDLAAKGWIKQEQKQYAMHPIISEMLYAELQPTIENCNTLIHTIKQQLNEEEFSTLIWQEKEKRLEYGVFLAKRIKERSIEATLLYNAVGSGLNTMSRYRKALEYEEKALKIRREVLGEKHAYTADSYNNIGCIYSSLGESEKALKYHEKALEIRREVLGEKHADTASSYDNLGIGYEELGGIMERMRGFMYKLKALEIRMEVLGEKHVNTAMSYNNVGISYCDLGYMEKGLKYQERALEIFEEVLGKRHVNTATLYYNVGNSYRKLGEKKKGLEYEEKALEILKEVLGERHVNTAKLYNNVGEIYYDLGSKEKGLKYQEKALEIRREVLGERNADMASSYKNVGEIYWNLSYRKGLEYEEKAIDYMKKALDIYMAVLGNEHPTTRETLALLKAFQDFQKWKKLRK